MNSPPDSAGEVPVPAGAPGHLAPADIGRRSVVGMAGRLGFLAAGFAAAGPSSSLAASVYDAAAHAPGPREALRILMEGNRRWARGAARHPRQSVRWRSQVAGHQSPFATVISCIDSRVPPEIVFDAGLGDMFVIRTGAQALDAQVVLGSIEFGPVDYSSVRLLFVLGHQNCGAVIAAIKVIESGARAPGHIQAIVEALRPAYRVARPLPGNLVDNMVRAQTRLTVQRLKADPLLSRLGLLIVGGRYDLYTGLIELLG